MFPKDSREYKLLSKLNTPEKIQTFLEKIPFNHEKGGETCMSPKRVLRERKAHCIEGALLACVCFMLSGEKPFIVNLKVKEPDVDHVIVVFKKNGYYGALSKTNHAVLRYRDPIYRSVRELVMTYFHEYYLYANGLKTLLGYSDPINVRRFGEKWITAEEELWEIAERIYDAPIHEVVPSKNRRLVRKATSFETKILQVREWKTTDTR